MRHFRHNYLKVNTVSKSEGTRKVKYAYYVWNCADAVYQKLSKLVDTCWNYSLPKLVRFLRHRIVWTWLILPIELPLSAHPHSQSPKPFCQCRPSFSAAAQLLHYWQTYIGNTSNTNIVACHATPHLHLHCSHSEPSFLHTPIPTS